MDEVVKWLIVGLFVFMGGFPTFCSYWYLIRPWFKTDKLQSIGREEK